MLRVFSSRSHHDFGRRRREHPCNLAVSLQMPYFGLASLTDPAPQTLGATSFPCFGKAPAVLFKRLQAACDANPNLRLTGVVVGVR